MYLTGGNSKFLKLQFACKSPFQISRKFHKLIGEKPVVLSLKRSSNRVANAVSHARNYNNEILGQSDQVVTSKVPG